MDGRIDGRLVGWIVDGDRHSGVLKNKAQPVLVSYLVTSRPLTLLLFYLKSVGDGGRPD